MVRNQQRKPGSRNYRNCEEEALAKCLAMIRSNKMSLSKASREFKISKAILSNRLNNVKQEGKAGGEMYLSVDFEENCFLRWILWQRGKPYLMDPGLDVL